MLAARRPTCPRLQVSQRPRFNRSRPPSRAGSCIDVLHGREHRRENGARTDGRSPCRQSSGHELPGQANRIIGFSFGRGSKRPGNGRRRQSAGRLAGVPIAEMIRGPSGKEQLVAELHDVFEGGNASWSSPSSPGLTVAEVTDLRRQMREAGASFKVTKNRLAKSRPRRARSSKH